MCKFQAYRVEYFNATQSVEVIICDTFYQWEDEAHGPPHAAADSLTFNLDMNVTQTQSAASVFHTHTRFSSTNMS